MEETGFDSVKEGADQLKSSADQLLAGIQGTESMSQETGSGTSWAIL
ncbi:MAG: hypothetical protein ACLVG5_06435 [Clostridium sp.]